MSSTKAYPELYAVVEIDAINSKKWTFCLTIIVVIHDATPSLADTAMYNRLNKKSETGIIISLLTGLYNRYLQAFFVNFEPKKLLPDCWFMKNGPSLEKSCRCALNKWLLDASHSTLM